MLWKYYLLNFISIKMSKYWKKKWIEREWINEWLEYLKLNIIRNCNYC